MRNAVDALRVRPFRWWFIAQIVAGAGNMTQAVALAWLVLELGGGGVALGLLAAFTFGPSLLLGVHAGTLVDRVDRRRLLLGTQSALLVLGVVLGVLTATGAIRLWSVFAVAAVTGVVIAADWPARQVYVLELVGPERTAGAVSLYEVVINASRVLGPGVGGVLLATAGISVCFFVNAVTFAFPIAVLLRHRPAARVRERSVGGAREGLRHSLAVPPIRACMLIAIAAGMVFNTGIALPLVATRAFHLGASGYGLLLAAFGIGAIPGALMASAGGAWPAGERVRALTVATGAAVLATATAPELWMLFAGMAVLGFFSIWLVSLANTLVQLRAAPALRGRVMGVWSMAMPGTFPITGLALGFAADAVGPREGFALAGVALLASAAAGWRALADAPARQPTRAAASRG
jgi:MFS family permease